MTQLDRVFQGSSSLPIVDEWLATLRPEDFALLRAHCDSKDLPKAVLELLRAGPMSPMQVSSEGRAAAAHMPPELSKALRSLNRQAGRPEG